MVCASGTTSEMLLNKLNDEKNEYHALLAQKIASDSFRTLESGRAVAFMMDDALLAGERAKAKNLRYGRLWEHLNRKKLMAVCYAR